MSTPVIVGEVIDSRLLSINRILAEREQLRLQLHNCCDTEDSRATLTDRLSKIQESEQAAIRELVELRADMARYQHLACLGTFRLQIVDDFQGFRKAQLIANGKGLGARYVMTYSSKENNSDSKKLFDVRFYVVLAGERVQVLELIHDLIQFFTLLIRYDTKLELKDFFNYVRLGLVERLADVLFYKSLTIPEECNQITTSHGPSVQELEKEIESRFEKVQFYLRERKLLESGLSKYTNRTFHDELKESTKHDIQRIRVVDSGLLHELIHLADSVKKWFDKYGRITELSVIEGTRLFKISANLVNVLKHGIRGRNQDCGVVEFECFIFEQQADTADHEDRLIGVQQYANFNGEIFSLTDLGEDLCILWELFLRYHSTLPIQKFQDVFGKIMASRKGKVIYKSAEMPGLEKWAQGEAQRRKHLDLK